MPELSASGKTWLVVGASRGIGYEFVRQLLMDGNDVLATIRTDAAPGQLWPDVPGVAERCQLFKCDMLDDASIDVQSPDIVFPPEEVTELDEATMGIAKMIFENFCNFIRGEIE